ncbi:hypothetical protein Tco_1405338 [Tanacetum coccineum]
MSTRDNLKPHLQIDSFPGFEADYPFMAIMDTCLLAMHTALTLRMKGHLDHSCLVPLLFSSLVIFDKKKLGSS